MSVDHVEVVGYHEPDERFRCRCDHYPRDRGGWPCVRRATQEDMLCDVCRPDSRPVAAGWTLGHCATVYWGDPGRLVSCHVEARFAEVGTPCP